jgi:PST family polysaccharide transporter
MSVVTGSLRGRFMRSSAFLMADVVLRQVSSFVTAVAIARTLGADASGVFGVAVSVSALGVGISALGLDGVLVREFVVRRGLNRTDLVSVCLAKAATSVVAFAAIAAYATMFVGFDRSSVTALLIVAFGYLLGNLDVGDLFLQSHQDFRAIAVRRIGTAVGMLAVKLAAVQQGSLAAVAVAMAVEMCLLQLVLLPRVLRVLRTEEARSDRLVDLRRVLGLVTRTWKLQLSSVLAVLNQRVDVVLVGALLSVTATGLYSSAGRLADGLVIVAGVISAVFYPRLIGVADDPGRYALLVGRLVRTLATLAVVASVVTALLSTRIMTALFGPEFAPAGPVLAVYVVGTAFLFFRSAMSKLLIIESEYGLSLLSNGAGAVTNIAVNLLLIPQFGILGAAVATVISNAMSSILALLITARGRSIVGFLVSGLLPGAAGSRVAARAARHVIDARPVVAR